MNNEELIAAARAVNADHSTKLAIDKAKRPRIVYDITEDGDPDAKLDPTGAIVWIEVETDEGGTLLVDPAPDLVCEPLLGWQLQRFKKIEIETGHVEKFFEVLPIGAQGEIKQYYCIEYPNGVLTFSDGRYQTAEERAQLLAAKRKFFEGK